MNLTIKLPSDWYFPKLEELALSEKGSIKIGPFGSALKKHEYSDKGIRVLGIDHVLQNELVWTKPKFISLKKYEELRQYAVQGGDILVTNMGTVGRTCFVPENFPKAIISSHLIKVTLDHKKTYPAYIAWALNFCPVVLGQIKSKCQGAIMDGFNSGLLKSLQIPLPPLPEQCRIAAILDKADAIRRKRAEAVRLADDFLKSAFLDMFGDPVTNPKGWKIQLFGDVGELDRGRSRHRPRNAPELLGGPYPLIQTGDVANSGGYIRSYTQTYSELGLAQSKMWPVGTLCITIAANIAKTAILTIEACFPDSVVGFRPNGKVRTEYIQYWMAFLQKILEENAPESAQKNINLEILRALKLPIPPISLQDAFVTLVQKTELNKDKMQKAAQDSDALFDSLIQRAFRGGL